jgi:SAM-dependent methyltransferase
MLKILKKIKFDEGANRMANVGEAEQVVKNYKIGKNKNLDYLLLKRFSWMNKFIKDTDNGLEVGAGAGLSKKFILNKNLKISDFSDHQHLDFKNVDAQNTKFNNESFDYIISSNMLHHIPYPIKFFEETHRILKKNGKLIIEEVTCSLILQLATILMKHEGFDFTVDPWSRTKPVTDEANVWSGNIAVTNLIFDNIKLFSKNIGNLYNIEHQKNYECFIFLNSGGVCSTTFYVPLNIRLLKILDKLDGFLTKYFPNIFATGRQIVLRKI